MPSRVLDPSEKGISGIPVCVCVCMCVNEVGYFCNRDIVSRNCKQPGVENRDAFLANKKTVQNKDPRLSSGGED